MSKSNATPTPDLGSAATFTVRELRDDELQEVSGGASTLHGPDSDLSTLQGLFSWFYWR
jgi:bacteriocin-like protein